MNYRQLSWRADDQKYFVADNSKASRLLGWQPQVATEDDIENTIAWEQARRV